MAKAKAWPPSKRAVKAPVKADATPPAPARRAPDIQWAKNPQWTQSIINYLTNHLLFRIKLFSDSTRDSVKEGRTKIVAKDGRPQHYATLAKHVFAEEESMKDAYALQPSRFATSVDTRLRR